MKRAIQGGIFLIMLISCLPATGQRVDMLPDCFPAEFISATIDISADSDDFSTGMLFFVAIGMAAVCIGLVILLAALLVFFSFIFVGLLSTSIFVGIYQKSFTSGFKTFFIGGSGIGGICVASIAFGVLNMVNEWWSVQTAILYGSLFGLSMGLIFGYLGYRLFRAFLKYSANFL